ncbi:hypothetical protein [Roseivivax isoporae]|uniref:Uncharacterized protein n=1 Tax=Roseivivax isoporae LMG 25204 TaxID=1449351 RepID=X7F138_9RHOB|nr:hypothetical protein [Roseivivax isoporae]ETX26480.1 hypothetical protein RISW2_01735 [Roseivivax isoporae LMG 25204]
MSDYAKVPCTCPIDRQLPPGSGFVLASLLGLGAYALAACVLLVSGSWLWTLLTWLLASSIGLAGVIAMQAVREHLARRACLDARCRFRDLLHPRWRSMNV